MLTARDSVDDRVAGLDTGADDYLVKPFAFAELLARLRALARRGDAERPSVLEVGDLRLDPASREVRRGDSEIRLSAKEFALLETFMRRPGQVLSRLHLLEHAWDFAYENRSNVVDVYVRHLRRKIDEPLRSPLPGDGSRRGLPVAGGWGVSGLPIRFRVTAALAVAMALVLAASGWFLYARLESHLAVALDAALQVRAQDLAALVHQPNASLAEDSGGRLIERGESFAQLVDPGGHVLEATKPLGSASLLHPPELVAAGRNADLCEPLVRPGPQRALAAARHSSPPRRPQARARRRRDARERARRR